MLKTQLYFLTEQYYLDFPDDYLMKNGKSDHENFHNRPCFLAFRDSKNPKIFWVVPISSRIEKYQKIAKRKEQKYGVCETIRFGTVLGRNTAFLIQNMCPATEQYLIPYLDKNRRPVQIDNRVVTDVERYARKVLAKAMRGSKVIFPDVFKIYDILNEK